MADLSTDKSEQRADQPGKSSAGKRAVLAVAVILAALAGYLFVWPSPIDPIAYEPPPAPKLEGPFAPNDLLQSAELLAVGKVIGPEDVEVDDTGHVYTGTEDGKIVRVDPDDTVTVIATTGGRPVGIARAPDGRLIVADAIKGLLAIDDAGKIETLYAGSRDEPLGFADDLDIAHDGTIYFSDASSKFGPDAYLYDMLEARAHGRLLQYDPATKETTKLLGDLHFANGVALSQNEDFVLVNETYRFRIVRYWLTGERAGTSEVFVDNLPGYPDNITSNRRGTFWLALFTVRNEDADRLAPRPFVKSVLAKLPGFLWPKPRPYAFVVELDETGKVRGSYQDPEGKHLREVTSAFERGGHLYLGSLHNDRIGKFKLPAAE